MREVQTLLDATSRVQRHLTCASPSGVCPGGLLPQSLQVVAADEGSTTTLNGSYVCSIQHTGRAWRASCPCCAEELGAVVCTATYHVGAVMAADCHDRCHAPMQACGTAHLFDLTFAHRLNAWQHDLTLLSCPKCSEEGARLHGGVTEPKNKCYCHFTPACSACSRQSALLGWLLRAGCRCCA